MTFKEFGDEGLGCVALISLKVHVKSCCLYFLVRLCLRLKPSSHINFMVSLQPGDIALKVPERYTVTSVDVSGHPVVSSLAAGLCFVIASSEA